MRTQHQLSYRARALIAPVALLAFLLLLPASVVAQHGGGHGGGHSGGHGGGHSGGHGGGHSSGHGGGHFGGHFGFGHLSFSQHYGYGYPYSYRYGSGYYGAPYYRGYGRSYGSAYADGRAAGALDLDVEPARTAIYEEGQYLGTVDDFDGFPNYLWLSPGTHELTFYLEGYRTMVRQFTVRPGQIGSVNEALERGDSIRPEERSEVRPADRPGERPRADRPPRRGLTTDLRREPGRLHLEIVPADASVYLDGRFVGTGEDLVAGLVIDPGSHEVDVVRPDRLSSKWSFEVEPGGEVEKRIELATRQELQ